VTITGNLPQLIGIAVWTEFPNITLIGTNQYFFPVNFWLLCMNNILTYLRCGIVLKIVGVLNSNIKLRILEGFLGKVLLSNVVSR
jgi:hypothetical protein